MELKNKLKNTIFPILCEWGMSSIKNLSPVDKVFIASKIFITNKVFALNINYEYFHLASNYLSIIDHSSEKSSDI